MGSEGGPGDKVGRTKGGEGLRLALPGAVPTAGGSSGTHLPQGQPVSGPGSSSSMRPGASSIATASGASPQVDPLAAFSGQSSGDALHHFHLTQHSRHRIGPEWKHVLTRMRLGMTAASDLSALMELAVARH
eukprot:gene6908-7124_t